jgi:hypothetical protein
LLAAIVLRAQGGECCAEGRDASVRAAASERADVYGGGPGGEGAGEVCKIGHGFTQVFMDKLLAGFFIRILLNPCKSVAKFLSSL